jgi:hypothetical protein
MKYIKVRIVIGSSNGVFDIYYDNIDSNKRATLHSNGLPATGLTFSELSTTDGVIVSVPDESTSIVVSSDPDSFCSIDSNVNNDSYTIPIGCYTYTVTSNIGIFNYYYTDCECNEITRTIDGTNGQVEHTFCALYNTVNAGELEVTSISGCQSTTLELCYDENLPSLACECEIVPTPTPTPTSTPTQYYVLVGPYSTSYDACVAGNQTGAVMGTYTVTNGTIEVNSIVYSNPILGETSAVTGAPGWYSISASFIGIYNSIRLDSAGKIVELGGDCIL